LYLLPNIGSKVNPTPPPLFSRKNSCKKPPPSLCDFGGSVHKFPLIQLVAFLPFPLSVWTEKNETPPFLSPQKQPPMGALLRGPEGAESLVPFSPGDKKSDIRLEFILALFAVEPVKLRHPILILFFFLPPSSV